MARRKPETVLFWESQLGDTLLIPACTEVVTRVTLGALG